MLSHDRGGYIIYGRTLGDPYSQTQAHELRSDQLRSVREGLGHRTKNELTMTVGSLTVKTIACLLLRTHSTNCETFRSSSSGGSKNSCVSSSVRAVHAMARHVRTQPYRHSRGNPFYETCAFGHVPKTILEWRGIVLFPDLL